MNCPRCNGNLQSEGLKQPGFSLLVDKCESCGGILFKKGELSQIENYVKTKAFEIRRIPGKKEQLKELTCPNCNNLTTMEKYEHHRDMKVICDYCPQCGSFWLDKGELEAIQNENWMITIGNIHRSLISG